MKDAASSAIYGARAANGVVIITTKKGAKDGGGQITYEGSYSISNPWRLPTLLNAEDYIMITREKFANSGQGGTLNTLGFPNVGDPIPVNTNWMDVIFEPANINNHRLSASTKNTFMSLDYWDEKGVIGGDKSKFTRYSLRLNSTKEINDYITVGENLFVARNENRSIGDNSNTGGTALINAFAYAIENSEEEILSFTSAGEINDWMEEIFVPLFRGEEKYEQTMTVDEGADNRVVYMMKLTEEDAEVTETKYEVYPEDLSLDELDITVSSGRLAVSLETQEDDYIRNFKNGTPQNFRDDVKVYFSDPLVAKNFMAAVRFLVQDSIALETKDMYLVLPHIKELLEDYPKGILDQRGNIQTKSYSSQHTDPISKEDLKELLTEAKLLNGN